MSDLIINNHIIDTPIETILRQIKQELTNGKLEKIEKRGDNFCVTCPTHKAGHEQKPSCYIYCGNSSDIEYGTMHCFTCGESGPLYHFVAECFDKNDAWGKAWLLERFGSTLVETTVKLPDFDLSTKDEEFLDESILDSYQSWHPYMAKRKLSPKVCETFKIKYDPKSECLVFPVWDEFGRLYMLTRRSVLNKRFIIDANKEKPVYLLNFIKKFSLKEVTIVESQINCLTLWSMGIPSCALFGTGTEHQYKILNKSGIRHYYLCFDGDDAGDKGIKRFLKNINKDVFVDIILMTRGKDVNDLTQEEFDALPIISSDDWLKNNT